MSSATTAQFKRFIELDDAGMSARLIAENVHVSERTIQRWRKQTGRMKQPPTQPYPPDVRERARILLNDGCSLMETAASLKVSTDTIRRWFPDHPGWTRRESGLFRSAQRNITDKSRLHGTFSLERVRT